MYPYHTGMEYQRTIDNGQRMDTGKARRWGGAACGSLDPEDGRECDQGRVLPDGA